MSHKAPPLSGLRWEDVEEWVKDFEEEHRVRCVFSTSRQPEALGRPMGLLIELTVTGVQESGRKGFVRVFRASWPTYGHKTMPGLYLYLVHSAREGLHYLPPKYGPQRKSPAYPPG